MCALCIMHKICLDIPRCSQICPKEIQKDKPKTTIKIHDNRRITIMKLYIETNSIQSSYSDQAPTIPLKILHISIKFTQVNCNQSSFKATKSFKSMTPLFYLKNIQKHNVHSLIKKAFQLTPLYDLCNTCENYKRYICMNYNKFFSPFCLYLELGCSNNSLQIFLAFRMVWPISSWAMFFLKII